MSNKNYPNMFDEQIANPEFLDSLESIAKEPFSHKIRARIEPFRVIAGAVILFLYGNTILDSLYRIYFYYAEQINMKIVNIQIANAYAEDLVEIFIK
tara:strand:+ start:5034 stop:5324 length:291 start_codon:yes stop_codon:yes gene_type:complete